MTPQPVPTLRTLAAFETTKRLLAALINESLVSATLIADQTAPVRPRLKLQSNHFSDPSRSSKDSVTVGIAAQSSLNASGKTSIEGIHPEDMVLPVVLRRENSTGTAVQESYVSDPGVIFDFVDPQPGERRKENSETLRWRVREELRISAARQETWFHWAQKRAEVSLNSPLIEWERAIIRGHPLHPMHRTCFPQFPLLPLDPEDFESITDPEIVFAAIPRASVHITGPFEELLGQLLTEMNIGAATHDRIIIPCLKRQVPAIQQIMEPQTLLLSPTTLQVQAQSSSRTVTIPPQLKFPYYLKLALNCTISATTRTMSAAARAGPQLSRLLENILPPELWVFKETACVTGAQKDSAQAKQLGCILREDLEGRARANGEVLVPCAALAERGAEGGPCHAERVFKLGDLETKRDWFRRYSRCLLKLVLPPLILHGVGLEAHSQNMVARINLQNRRLVGFAIRDFGGIKLHMPTVRNLAPDLAAAPLDAYQTREKLEDVFTSVYAFLFRAHLAQFVHALGLQNAGGWAVVREELDSVLEKMNDPRAVKLRDFLMAERLPISCYLRTKLDPPSYGYVSKSAPNVMLG